MPIPCVVGNIDGLSVFQASADQRYALGEDLFLETHLPVRFWVRQASANKIWSEMDLLRLLSQPPSTLKGNRVFVLFGAAGAGKSEVMRWILSKVNQTDPTRAHYAVRVARTELDPVRITARILDTFKMPGLGEDALRRWDELQRKPVALANQLVWHAVTGLFETDEEILPLSFRLRPVVEANLRAGFAAMSDPAVATRPLQLIGREQLEQVLADTVLDIDPVYEHIRARLQAALEQHALGGLSLVRSLRTISKQVREQHGVRPILIIDDLVQSLNVYASDILDYLITLEEGEWDVVLGLTPAAFEWDRRGRELLLRIRELDTIDDRVVKLDLSDTTGDTSSFLDEDSANAFLGPYLRQYKQAAGFHCDSSCPHWNGCEAFQWGQQPGAELSPLSRSLVRRMWRRLPRGKGRARYLLLAVRQVLELMATSGAAALPELVNLVDRDIFVDNEDSRLKSLVECYHPGGEADVAGVPETLASTFGIATRGEIEVSSLTSPELAASGMEPGRSAADHPGPDTDPVRAAVRDWLEGGRPNRELLKPLRNGLNRLLRDVVDPTVLVGVHVAQPNGALRWAAVHDGVTIPIALEGIDEKAGIFVSRTLRTIAFDLLTYADAKGPTKVALIGRLLEQPQVTELFFQAEALRKSWLAHLEQCLGCGVEELAFHLYRVALAFGAELPELETLGTDATAPLPGLKWPEELGRAIKLLWEDCFRIRENLYAGHLLARFQGSWPAVEDSIRILEPVLRMRIPDTIRLVDQPMVRVLSAFRTHIERIQALLEVGDFTLEEVESLVDLCERLTDGRRRAAIQRRWLALSQVARGLVIVTPIPQLPCTEDVRYMLELAKDLRDLMGKGTLSSRYRLHVAFRRLENHPWVHHVIHWRNQLQGVCLQVRTLRNPGAKESSQSSLPNDVTELLQETTAFLTEGVQRAAAESQVESIRGLVSSDEGRFAHKLANLLALVLPQEFEVAQTYAVHRRECATFLQDWDNAQRWLSRSTCEVPTRLPKRTAVTLAGWQRTIRAACAWWAAYVCQFSVLVPSGASTKLTRVSACLGKVATFEQLTEDDVLGWQGFLTYALRLGATRLPIHTLLDRYDLPENLQQWLKALAEEGARGLALARLSPHVLAEIQGRYPQWAKTIRVSLIPEGDSDGVLCVLDGQRPRVSDL